MGHTVTQHFFFFFGRNIAKVEDLYKVTGRWAGLGYMMGSLFTKNQYKVKKENSALGVCLNPKVTAANQGARPFSPGKYSYLNKLD